MARSPPAPTLAGRFAQRDARTAPAVETHRGPRARSDISVASSPVVTPRLGPERPSRNDARSSVPLRVWPMALRAVRASTCALEKPSRSRSARPPTTSSGPPAHAGRPDPRRARHGEVDEHQVAGPEAPCERGPARAAEGHDDPPREADAAPAARQDPRGDGPDQGRLRIVEGEDEGGHPRGGGRAPTELGVEHALAAPARASRLIASLDRPRAGGRASAPRATSEPPSPRRATCRAPALSNTADDRKAAGSRISPSLVEEQAVGTPDQLK